MRILRIGLFCVATVCALGLGNAFYPHWDRPAPAVALGPDGCPRVVFEHEFDRVPGAGPWPLSKLPHDLAPDGAVSAVLCAWSWESDKAVEVLRLTRRVGELQRFLADLPSVKGGGIGTAMGFGRVNLVLGYPDGTSMPMTFDFNRNHLTSRVAVRRGATRVTREFVRLWQAENTVADPTKIPPADCLQKLPRDFDRLRAALPPAIPRGENGFDRRREAHLPVPVAVVRACRYVEDGRKALRLRGTGWTREGLAEIRAAVERARQHGDRCRGRDTAVDTLHLTDATGRTLTVFIARKPCGYESLYGLPVGGPLSPELAAVATRLLG
ncbi:hypothetical protein GCM10022221_75950 [Actinocorallia aurea]